MAAQDGDGDGTDELDGDGGPQGDARNGLVKGGIHGDDDDAKERGDGQVGKSQAAAPGAFPCEENERSRDDAPPCDGCGLNRGEGNDGERGADVLDERRADNVELGWDAVADDQARGGTAGTGSGSAHCAGAKVSAAEFMQ